MIGPGIEPGPPRGEPETNRQSYGAAGDEKHPLSLPGIEPRFFGR
jgi:hypothetical protein